jgi:chromosome partitioning protein
MHTIAIVNEKGGTGKTTTSVSLSAALGRLGQRVLLVDLDGQASTSRWFGVEEDDRLADALLAGEGLEPIENIAPGVSLAPATGKVDSVARDLRPSQSAQLRKVLRQVQDRYDLIIMDCPPSLNNRLIGNALLAATHVLVPVETSIMALDGLQILLTTLEDMSEAFEHQIVLAGVVACRYDIRTRLSRLVLDELRRALPNKVFNTVIRENVRMRECPASGQSILEFAPDSHAAEDYLALAKEMLTNPDAWQQPAHWERKDASEIDDETQRCSVDSLRSRAAATVRAGVAKTSQTKPLTPVEAPAEALAPPPDEQAEPAQDGAAHAAINRWTGGPLPNRAVETHEPPADIPAAAMALECSQSTPDEQAEPAQDGAAHAAINRWTGGPLPNRAVETHEPPADIPAAAIALECSQSPPPDQAGLDSYINRLAQAKARLSAPDIQAETDELPAEPEPAAAAQGFEPAPVAPAQAAFGTARNVPPPEPEDPDEPEKPEELETGAVAFPALRAMLRQMGHAHELAGVGSAGGQDARNGR